jgi:hypothetical protein
VRTGLVQPTTGTNPPPPRPLPLHAPSLKRTERTAPATELRQARAAARTFYERYLAYIYGRRTGRAVAPVDQQLREQLSRARVLVTPAGRRARPRIAHIVVAALGPPASIRATAFKRDRGHEYSLQTTLECRHRRWLVVAIDP